jgi:chromosome segregation and condensation protein ScpB
MKVIYSWWESDLMITATRREIRGVTAYKMVSDVEDMGLLEADERDVLN